MKILTKKLVREMSKYSRCWAKGRWWSYDVMAGQKCAYYYYYFICLLLLLLDDAYW